MLKKKKATSFGHEPPPFGWPRDGETPLWPMGVVWPPPCGQMGVAEATPTLWPPPFGLEGSSATPIWLVWGWPRFGSHPHLGTWGWLNPSHGPWGWFATPKWSLGWPPLNFFF
jgi:hypothetical protein